MGLEVDIFIKSLSIKSQFSLHEILTTVILSMELDVRVLENKAIYKSWKFPLQTPISRTLYSRSGARFVEEKCYVSTALWFVNDA